jgi:transcriptional regulator with XRE-family HTH domain
LSQGDVEKRSGSVRVYVSRVENGHTVPSVGTLEKLAHALEVPLYQFFYDGKESPEPTHLLTRKTKEEAGMSREEIHLSQQLRQLLARMAEADRRLLLALAQKTAGR